MQRRSLVGTLAAAALTAGLLSPQLAQSAPADTRAERERVRAEQAQVASQLDVSRASMAEIDDALQTLDENLQTQEAALARTEAQVAQAEQDIADAEAAIARLQGQITVLRADIRQRAVQAYVQPVGEDVLSILESQDFVTASSRKFYLEIRSQDDADVGDRLNGALAEIDFQREKAEAARAEAEAKRAEQAERTEAVRAARQEKAALSERIQATIDTQIARSLELQATDRELSKRIAQEQALLVARLAAQKAAEEEAARQQAAAAAQAAQAPAPAPAPSNQSPSGGETGPLPPVSGGGGGVGTGGISLCTVGGITVNCAIQGQVTNLLNAARADGLALSGGGYRDPSSQIELRKKHCGTSYYAIYQMSPSACRPPTARPGQSQHEVGLAIDFSNCSSRGTACFQWLAANASRFGFYNLPSEPWHWSTTGS